MKLYAIAAALILTLTGCANAAETNISNSSETAAPSDSESSDSSGIDLSPGLNSNDEEFQNLLTNLMNSCDKGLAEGMVELGNGARVVVLPESEAYESYSAFYELEDKSYSELIFSLDFSSACYLPMSASNYSEGAVDENGNIDWSNFPIKVEKLDENRFLVVDSSQSTEDLDLGFESIYVFENGLLVSQEIEDFSVELTYGDWTEEDTETLKGLVDELFAEQ